MSEATTITPDPSTLQRQRDMRLLVMAGIVGIALGWFAGTSPSSPIRPNPKPDRPVLRFIAKVAKVALWALVAAEPPPPQHAVVHARIGHDGHQVLNHSEGW